MITSDESQDSIITEENIKAFIDDNMNRSAVKYSKITHKICQDCKAILDINLGVCPNCGSGNMAGLYTDGK